MFSDRRLKTKLSEIEQPLRQLSKIRGVYFHWDPTEVAQHNQQTTLSASASGGGDGSNTPTSSNIVSNRPFNFDEQRHVGLIAQELLKVLPEVVDQSLSGGRFLRCVIIVVFVVVSPMMAVIVANELFHEYELFCQLLINGSIAIAALHSVDYGSIVALLVEAINELHQNFQRSVHSRAASGRSTANPVIVSKTTTNNMEPRVKNTTNITQCIECKCRLKQQFKQLNEELQFVLAERTALMQQFEKAHAIYNS